MAKTGPQSYAGDNLWRLNMKNKVAISLSMAILINCQLEAKSKTFIDQTGCISPMKNWAQEAEFVPGKNLNGTVAITYDPKTGFLKRLTVDNKGIDPQISCAVVDYFILQQPTKYTSGLGMELPIAKIPLAHSETLKNVLKRNQNLTSDTVVVRALPPSILKRYPNVFNKNDVFNEKNFRALPSKLASIQGLKTFRQPWIDFFAAHPTATKEQLLSVLSAVDANFKTDYLPLK